MRTALLLIMMLAGFSFNGSAQQKKFTGIFSNGYKGSKISFMLSADGKQLKDLTFDGHWRCSGSTEQITVGPEKSFRVVNGKVKGVITDPEDGGASAFRFEIDGVVNGKQASGTFRMSITGLSCDTYKLQWTAKAS
ncbi:MAG TPA: hypothetical protein VGE26_06780 [Sphingobacteriaceae bacterium]